MLNFFATFQKGVGLLLTAVLATSLILLWIISVPFFQGGVLLGDLYRKRFHPEIR